MNQVSQRYQEALVQSTCSVVVKLKARGRSSEVKRWGTGFFISSGSILTAAHILQPPDMPGIETTQILCRVPSGELVEARISRADIDLDLALLETTSELDHPHINHIDDIPEIGTDCMWCGYPLFIGERTRHLRFGWGKVSSNPSPPDSSVFYVDGNFSPAHSGSPILDLSSGNLIGVVSRSAGDPRFQFEKIKILNRALYFMTQRMDSISELFDAFEDLAREAGQNGPVDQVSFFPEGEIGRPEREIPSDILEILKEVGVELSEDRYHNIVHSWSDSPTDEKPYITRIRISGFDKVLEGIIRLVSRVSSTLEQVIDETYQMGVGLARGGQPVIDFLRPELTDHS